MFSQDINLEKIRKEVEKNQIEKEKDAELSIKLGELTKNDCMKIVGVLNKFEVKVEKAAILTIKEYADFSSVLNVLQQAEMIFDDIMKGVKK